MTKDRTDMSVWNMSISWQLRSAWSIVGDQLQGNFSGTIHYNMIDWLVFNASFRGISANYYNIILFFSKLSHIVPSMSRGVGAGGGERGICPPTLKRVGGCVFKSMFVPPSSTFWGKTCLAWSNYFPVNQWHDLRPKRLFFFIFCLTVLKTCPLPQLPGSLAA